MTEETLKKVREPLFTTKSYGVGLGIPAIEKILDEHGGGLRIDTKLGEGTIMTAWFPSNLDKREAA
jgi:nitrogen fixation/metabolism regulation signal transduction histidine kinase